VLGIVAEKQIDGPGMTEGIAPRSKITFMDIGDSEGSLVLPQDNYIPSRLVVPKPRFIWHPGDLKLISTPFKPKTLINTCRIMMSFSYVLPLTTVVQAMLPSPLEVP
jgi:hypothetical protein